MKKILVALLVMIISTSSYAQTQIMYEDFDGGPSAGWDTVVAWGDYSVKWYWTNAGPQNWTNYGYSAGGPRFPTNANGWMLVDSDAGSGSLAVCDLITPAMNLTGYSTVRLRFYEQYVHYNNSHPEVWMSPDGFNWNLVYERSGLAINQATPATPKGDMVDIDVSSHIANSPSAYVRFRWSAYDDYWWNLDDVELYIPMQDDLSVLDAKSKMYINCGHDEFTITFENRGTDDATGIKVGFEVPGSAPVIENLPDTLEPGQTLTYTFASSAIFKDQGKQFSKVFVNISGDGDNDNDTALVEGYYVDSIHTLPMHEDFDQGGLQNGHIYSRKHGGARITDTARFSGPFGYLIEGGLGQDWTFLTDTADVFRLNELHATYYTFCVDPDTAKDITMDFSAQLQPSHFLGSAENYFSSLQITAEGNREWQLYDTTFKVDQNVDLSKHIGGLTPIAVTFEARNKYSNKGATIANGNDPAKGDFSFLDNIDIYEVIPPIADYEFTKNNLQVTFSDSSLNNPSSWIWDFGDGDSAIAQNPVHVYAIDGIYDACMIVMNKMGSDTTCQEVNVQLLPPSANFSFSKNGLEISFTDETLNFPDEWDWDFGDGSGTSTDQNPAYNYPKAKKYTVCLDVLNSAGSDDVCRAITVTVGLDEKDVIERMAIYPNPSQDAVNISLSLYRSQETELSILDMFGRTLHQQQFNASAFNDEIDVSDWPTGIYVVQLKSADIVHSSMMEIAR